VKKIAHLLPAIGLVALSMVAKADSTLKVINFGTGPDGSTGPYTLSLNNQTNLSLFCMNDDNYISQGESWNVKVYNGDDLPSSFSDKQYEEAAFIYSELNQTDSLANTSHHHAAPTFDNSDVQDALWAIFDPTNLNGTAEDLLKLAEQKSNYSNVDMSLYDFYIPDGGVKGASNGDSKVPQAFIGKDPGPMTPTPEPSTLALFGSGLLGMAGAVRRKLARA
jgi:hypothetical protein